MTARLSTDAYGSRKKAAEAVASDKEKFRAYCIALEDARSARILADIYDGSRESICSLTDPMSLFTEEDHSQATVQWTNWLLHIEAAGTESTPSLCTATEAQRGTATDSVLKRQHVSTPPASAVLPPGISPRGLTKVQACAYVGCSTSQAFEKLIMQGIFPAAMPRTKLWDRKALDVIMDRLSGFAARSNFRTVSVEHSGIADGLPSAAGLVDQL